MICNPDENRNVDSHPKILKDLIQSSFLCKEPVKTTAYMAGREHKSMKANPCSTTEQPWWSFR